jgi:deoxyribonuclease V
MSGVEAFTWPGEADRLEELQRALATQWAGEPAWRPRPDRPPRVGAVFAAPPRGLVGAGAAGDPAWVAAVVSVGGRLVDSAVVAGQLDAPYQPGLLALREGRALHQAVSTLGSRPEVLIVNATGRDHPRRAGLAIQLGAACDLPTIGVTDRTLVAAGGEPGPDRGAASELRLNGELVGYRLRTRSGARAVVVHAGWRVDPDTAWAVVLAVTLASRTPEPLRQARRLARTGRAYDATRS